MDLAHLVMLQKKFDENHGWAHGSSSLSETIELINKDIIGLVGEVGEFSNIIKKLNLLNNSSNNKEFQQKFSELLPDLKEEFIDAFIYLLRISSHLDMDISKEFLRKNKINEERFKKYENL